MSEPIPQTAGDSFAIPFHRRLTVRVAAVVFLLLVVIDVASTPLWTRLMYALTPEWSDPVYVREYLRILEAPAAQRDALWSTFDDGYDRRDRLVVYGAIVLYSLAFAAIVSLLVSHLATRRIRRLAEQVRPNAGRAALPDELHIDGSDEIRALADTMNQMRTHIGTLVNELEARDRERVQWVSGVSHDLRAPLTALSAAVARSRRQLAQITDGSVRDTLTSTLSAAQLDIRRLCDLAEHLLEIARLDSGVELVVEPVPAGQLLRNAVDSLRPLAEDRGVGLAMNYPPRLPQLMADGRQLVRAVENVVVNAIQHAECEVVVRASLAPDSLTVEIVDDGPGLPDVKGVSSLEHLGKDPHRADSTGLGLEVARRILEQHGGTLRGQNLPRGGASVMLMLPLFSTQ